MSANGTEKEPLAAKPLALDYLLSVVRDPQAEGKRRDSAAVAIASLGTLARREPSSNAPPVAGEATALSEDLLLELARGLVPFLREQIAAAVTPLQERIAELEKKKGIAPLAARLGALEATATKYRGVWNEDEAYAAGSLVTFQGGMWHCEDTNMGVRPGSGSSSWTLANKSRR